MELTFTLTEQDLRRAKVSMAFAQFTVGKMVQFAAAVIIFACLLEVLQAKQSAPDADLSWAAVRGAVYGLLLVTAFPLLLRFAASYGVRQQLRSNPGISGPLTYDFDNELIRYSGPNGRGEVQWSAYPWVHETKHQFLLCPQKNLGYPIPKRCFTRPADLDSFRSLIRSNVKNASLRKDSVM